MKTVCNQDMCAGCMACVDVCPKDAISIVDSMLAYNAVIDQNLCVGCGACIRVCQQNQPAELRNPIRWQEGWALDPDIRAAASSGGVAGAFDQSFLQNGGAVCSCVFADGDFTFHIVQNPSEAGLFSGSKYVKSNPSGIYPQIKALLAQEIPVLFIGLPCQCAAVQKYVGPRFNKDLYTADLICHGSPSPKVLDRFLQQHSMTRQDLCAPVFRQKRTYRFADTKSFTPPGIRDPYTLSFLNGLSFTENCYCCPYARQERVSDLTLGDSWGSSIGSEESAKGISLVLCQTDKGLALLKNARLYLQDADPQTAVASNHQLSAPSPRPQKRGFFLKAIKEGAHFNRTLFRCIPKQYLRQTVKGILFQLKRRKEA